MRANEKPPYFVWRPKVMLLSVLLQVCSTCCYAQQSSPGYSRDTAAVNHVLREAYKILNPDSAIILFDSALKLSERANFADGALNALMTKGIKYQEKDDYNMARSCDQAALPWAAKSSMKSAMAWCNNNIGLSYASQGDYATASEYYYIALEELKKKSAMTSKMAVNIYNNLALINLRLSQPDKALKFYDKGEAVAREGNFDYQLAIVLLNKSDYYTSTHKPDSAIKYAELGMAIGKKIGKVDLQANADCNIGKAYIVKGNYDKAIIYLQQAINLSRDRFSYIYTDAYYSLGDALYHQQKYKQAETIFRGVIEYTKQHDYKDRYLDLYARLIELYRTSGQYEKALNYTDTLRGLSDSMLNAEKVKAINLMDIKYKTAEKDKELAQNQLLIAQQKSKINQKNVWIISVVAGVVLLCVLLIFIYRNAKNKQYLQAKQIKILETEKTIAILKGVVQGEEQERSRLARELHDGIGGMLSAAMMRFRSIRHDNESVTSVAAYIEAMGMLDEVADEIRKAAHNLMPEVLLKQPFTEAVASYCNSVQEDGGLAIDLQCYGAFDELSSELKLNIYRILQELLKNITDHAQASEAFVQLMTDEHMLTITVEDNGRGFDEHQVKDGIGLHNLQTRISSLGGHYTLRSAPGKGTSVFIEFYVEGHTTALPGGSAAAKE